jgi:hypothetical protein
LWTCVRHSRTIGSAQVDAAPDTGGLVILQWWTTRRDRRPGDPSVVACRSEGRACSGGSGGICTREHVRRRQRTPAHASASAVCTADCTGTTSGLQWLRHPAAVARPARNAGTLAATTYSRIRDDGTFVLRQRTTRATPSVIRSGSGGPVSLGCSAPSGIPDESMPTLLASRSGSCQYPT